MTTRMRATDEALDLGPDPDDQPSTAVAQGLTATGWGSLQQRNDRKGNLQFYVLECLREIGTSDDPRRPPPVCGARYRMAPGAGAPPPVSAWPEHRRCRTLTPVDPVVQAEAILAGLTAAERQQVLDQLTALARVTGGGAGVPTAGP